MDLYDQFVGLVASGRHMDKARVKQLADGRAYTGRQALGLGLIDEIGGEQQALHWMQTARHLAADLPVTDVEKGTWFQRMTKGSAAGSLAGLILGAQSDLGQALHVDGVYALWQPSLMRN